MKVNFILLTVILFLGVCYILIANVTWYPFRSLKVKSEKMSNDPKFKQTPIFAEEKIRSRKEIDYHLKKRRDRVHYMCNTVKEMKDNITSVYKKVILNMIVDTKHNLTWCPIYKAASTVWMKNFAYLSGFSIGKNVMKQIAVEYGSIVKQKFQQPENFDEKLKKINGTTKFMVVRHPFERLLSAYRDKLENMQNRSFYYLRYGKYIKNNYREKHSDATSLEPTFKEFLKFLAKEKLFDEHWSPFYNACQPCSIDYDYVLKFEFLRNEYNFFINKNNLTFSVDYMRDRKNTSHEGITNDLVAEKYFQEIPRSLLKQIFKIYELDFFLFSYSPAKYYFMSNN